jgi:hypothetical protein
MNWRLIFEQSKVNGARYLGDELVQRVYKPLGHSWFQKRLDYVREQMKKEMLEGSELKVKGLLRDFPNGKELGPTS